MFVLHGFRPNSQTNRMRVYGVIWRDMRSEKKLRVYTAGRSEAKGLTAVKYTGYAFKQIFSAVVGLLAKTEICLILRFL